MLRPVRPKFICPPHRRTPAADKLSGDWLYKYKSTQISIAAAGAKKNVRRVSQLLLIFLVERWACMTERDINPYTHFSDGQTGLLR